jgi:arylsulfatase A-like enzyme
MRETGVSLERHYTTRFCAPTRAMLLTGVHPWRLGLQTDLNLNPVNVVRCSSVLAAKKLNARLLPEILRQDGGYATHMFGKFHMGHYSASTLPTQNGFDSFVGFCTWLCVFGC